jgi:hypothetical protein
VKPAYALITNEQSGIDAQATALGITTEKTAYDTAISDLNTYLATLTSPSLWSTTSGTTTVTRTTWDTKWTAVKTTKQTLINKMAAVAATTASWPSVTGTGRPEDSADITRWIDAPPQSTTFSYDSTGVAQSGEFPRTLTFFLMTPQGQITSGITWTYIVQNGTVNTFTNGDGSKAVSGSGTGSLSITSLGENFNTIAVSAAYASKTLVRTVDLRKYFSNASTTTGTIASQSASFTGPSSTTYVDVTGGGLTAQMPATKTTATIRVNLSAVPTSGTSGFWNVTCRVTRVISGTDTQLGSSSTASSNWFSSQGTGSGANFLMTISDTGLTSGTSYTWFVEMALSSGTRSHNVTGSVTVTA